MKSNFRMIADTPTYIALEDLGPWDQYLSITNDAESVYEAFSRTLNGRKLYYLDSAGDWTEIMYDDAGFYGFGFPPPAITSNIMRD